jgi:two-component system, cell cycle response regulator DivK
MAKRILLVEDRSDIRTMMAIYLTLNHYEVIEATNGYEAIESARACKPNIILMDMAMPVLDGIDSTRAIREDKETGHIPILCLTAFGEFYEDRAKAAGWNEILHKPVDFDQLDLLLQKHLSPKAAAH